MNRWYQIYIEGGKVVYNCCICGKEYKDRGNLSQHIIKIHNISYAAYNDIYNPIHIDKENINQCQICGKQYNNLKGLKIHFTKVHSDENFEEYIINNFPNSNTAKSILESKNEIEIDKNNIFQCQICGIDFSDKLKPDTALGNHVLYKHDIKYKDYKSLYFEIHNTGILYNEINSSNHLQCQLCGIVFENTQSISNHIKSHNMTIERYETIFFNDDHVCSGLYDKPCGNTLKRSGFLSYRSKCESCIETSSRPTQRDFWNRLYNFDEHDAEVAKRMFLKHNTPGFTGVSKISQDLFDTIYNLLDNNDKTNCYYHNNNGEYCVTYNHRCYRYDFVITGNTNKCIEFNGSKFHANPKYYEENDKPSPYDKNITSKDIWEADSKKIDVLFFERGITTLVIWDDEYKNNPTDVITRCMKFIGGINENS